LDSPQETQAFIIWFTLVIGKKKKKKEEMALPENR
jgi:hypothetical protein